MSGKNVLTLEETPKGKPLMTREKIGNSMFDIIGTEEQGYAIVMGTHRLTEWMESQEQVNQYIKDEGLDLTARIVSTMIQVYQDIQDAKSKTN